MLAVARERGQAAAHDNSEGLRDKIMIEYAPDCLGEQETGLLAEREPHDG